MVRMITSAAGCTSVSQISMSGIYETTLPKISEVVHFLVSRSLDILTKSILLTAGLGINHRYSSRLPSGNLISKMGHLTLPVFWMSGYAVKAQSTFLETLGGIGDDNAYALTVAADGGIFTSGTTTSFGEENGDALLVKLLANGSLDWATTLGGTAADYPYAMTVASDGGIIVGGRTYSFSVGNDNAFLSKWWPNGTHVWTKALGETGSDYIQALLNLSNGEIFAAGTTTSFGAGGFDVLLIKLWTNGTLAWTTTWGGTNNDFAYTLTTTSDGAIIVGGLAGSFGAGGFDALLAKWWTNGTLAWAKTIGGLGPASYSYFNALTTTSDGEIIAGGTTNSFGSGGYDLLLAKWWMNGTLAWVTTLGGTGYDDARTLSITSDGGIVAGGATNSFGSVGNGFLFAKWWTNGTLSWASTLDGTGNGYASASTITSDRGIIVGGPTSFGAGNDFMITKLTSEGEMPNCSYLQNILPNVSDVTSTITLSNINVTSQDWSSPILYNWSNVTINNVSPTLTQQCIPPATTGIATTGIVTTGVATTGQGTTGESTTGIATTGVATTGVATTGVMTTGIATTGVLTTGIATTGPATTGIATTGLATTGVATTSVLTTGLVTTGTSTTGSFGSPSTPSGKDTSPPSRKSADLGLILGLVFGLGLPTIVVGGVAGAYFWRRRKNALKESNFELQSSVERPSPSSHPYQNALSSSPYGMMTTVNPDAGGTDHQYENIPPDGASQPHIYQNTQSLNN